MGFGAVWCGAVGWVRFRVARGVQWGAVGWNRCGAVWFGLVWFGLVWCCADLCGYGLVWCDMSCGVA